LKNLATPIKIRELQRKLYCKAKAEPAFRFYQLYDKIWREDILAHAWALARANRGAPGVDGIDFEVIEIGGLENWLKSLQEELREKRYKPSAVRRVMIPKAGGGERPLGIPTIKDRVVQTAAKLVLEPIFEADMEPSAWGYRPKRSALDAVKVVHEALIEGYTQVVDADLSKYFDTIPHDDLMRSVTLRIVDRAVLALLKSWLQAPVQSEDSSGSGGSRMSGGKHHKLGTPQGGVISPILANRYMNRFLRYWEQSPKAQALETKIVAYADDFVILARSQNKAQKALGLARRAMQKLKLEINEAKTSVCNARAERFNFLGYSFGLHYNQRTGRTYLGASASDKSVQRCKDKISAMLNTTPQAWEEVCAKLNRMLKGWQNYFQHGSKRKSYRAIDAHVRTRVRNFLQRRHKVSSRGTRQFSHAHIFGDLGVHQLSGRK
jgi:RNA-directed DNA polymerase